MSSNMKLGTKFEPKKILLYLSVLSKCVVVQTRRIGAVATYGRERSEGEKKRRKKERSEE